MSIFEKLRQELAAFQKYREETKQGEGKQKLVAWRLWFFFFHPTALHSKRAAHHRDVDASADGDHACKRPRVQAPDKDKDSGDKTDAANPSSEISDGSLKTAAKPKPARSVGMEIDTGGTTERQKPSESSESSDDDGAAAGAKPPPKPKSRRTACKSKNAAKHDADKRDSDPFAWTDSETSSPDVSPAAPKRALHKKRKSLDVSNKKRRPSSSSPQEKSSGEPTQLSRADDDAPTQAAMASVETTPSDKTQAVMTSVEHTREKEKNTAPSAKGNTSTSTSLLLPVPPPPKRGNGKDEKEENNDEHRDAKKDKNGKYDKKDEQDAKNEKDDKDQKDDKNGKNDKDEKSKDDKQSATAPPTRTDGSSSSNAAATAAKSASPSEPWWRNLHGATLELELPMPLYFRKNGLQPFAFLLTEFTPVK